MDFKITIPKIEFVVHVDDINNKNKKKIEKSKKKQSDDYYFAILRNNPRSKKVVILTLQDCLTVPVYKLQKIDRKYLTKDTICGFNDVIPESRIVFCSKSLREIQSKIFTDRWRIYNQLTKYSPSLFDSVIIDVVNTNKMNVVWSYNLCTREEVSDD